MPASATAGLTLVDGELLEAATGRGAQLEGITSVLLLTQEDDFNALAATVLQSSVDGPVYRLRSGRDDLGVVAASNGGRTLFPAELTRPTLEARHARGEQIRLAPAGTELDPATRDALLFVIRSDGHLIPTDDEPPVPEPGDRLVLLGSGLPQPRLAPIAGARDGDAGVTSGDGLLARPGAHFRALRSEPVTGVGLPTRQTTSRSSRIDQLCEVGCR